MGLPKSTIKSMLKPMDGSGSNGLRKSFMTSSAAGITPKASPGSSAPIRNVKKSFFDLLVAGVFTCALPVRRKEACCFQNICMNSCCSSFPTGSSSGRFQKFYAPSSVMTVGYSPKSAGSYSRCSQTSTTNRRARRSRAQLLWFFNPRAISFASIPIITGSFWKAVLMRKADSFTFHWAIFHECQSTSAE